jgi:hypothetical protein
LRKCEAALSIALPSELRALLSQSNGVLGEYALPLVWPVEKIESTNREFRESKELHKLYMPFGHLLFFADSGNGDQFAYGLLADGIRKPDIFLWNHENDSRSWVAPRLDRLYEWWLSGRIEV